MDVALFSPQPSISLYVAANISVLLQTAQMTLQSRYLPRCPCHSQFRKSMFLHYGERGGSSVIYLFLPMDLHIIHCRSAKLSEPYLAQKMEGWSCISLTTPFICMPLIAQPVTLCANVYQCQIEVLPLKLTC